MGPRARSRWDAVVVGSGFGGAMAALRLAAAGARVLVLERGDRVARGPAASGPDGTLERTPHFHAATPYRCAAGGYRDVTGSCACVGGASVFYGGAALRLRVRDLEPDPELANGSGAAWPYRYADLEPYYGEAERLLQVAGDDAGDPTAPPRSAPYPHPPAPLAEVSRRLLAAARDLGLSPFRLPLAINHGGDPSRPRCTACRTCDTFACPIQAKNDVEMTVLRRLEASGATVLPRTVATRLEAAGRRVRRVVAVSRDDRRRVELEAGIVVLAGGALATPHLLLSSELAHLSPAPEAIGRYLYRHANAKVFGLFRSEPDRERVFHKQLAIHDWYFGEDGAKMGCVQQVTTPPRSLVELYLPRGLGRAVGATVEHLTGLLCIAEDAPRWANGVRLDRARGDAFGLPELVIEHRHGPADRQRLEALVRRAKRVLRRTGALLCHAHLLRTFSHALGTVRMGEDRRAAPLDERCRFRGLENLWVTDGSALPSCGAVNPSLTIAANALRAAEAMVRA